MRGEGRDERDVPLVQARGLAGERRKRPDDPVVVGERRGEAADDAEPVVIGRGVGVDARLVADVRVGEDVAGLQQFPAQPSSRR